MKSWFYNKAPTSLGKCLFLATILSACKTPQSANDDSTTKIVGGTAVDDNQVEATVAILTGCTGTFVTLDDYPVKNYVLTTTKCANEITSTDQRGRSSREAVIKEDDPAKDLTHTLGLIDYALVINPKTGKAPERRPARINFDPNSAKKGTQIQIVGYGCQDINQPNTDYDYSGYPQKRIGSNTIDTIDLNTGLITFRGPKSNAPSNKATICPRSNMTKDETADEGAPVIWNNRVGAITLYSKVVGDEIITTAKLLSYKTTDAFLKKWLGQDKLAEFPDVPASKWYSTENGKDAGRTASIAGKDYDWAPGARKVTCLENQAAFGVGQSLGWAEIGCHTRDSPGKWLDQKSIWIHNNSNEMVGRTAELDWANEERKFECPFDYFLVGLAVKATNPIGLTNILCAKTAVSTNFQDKQCRSIGTGTKATSCNQGEYIGGVSVKWMVPGNGGSNHIGYVLCCKIK